MMFQGIPAGQADPAALESAFERPNSCVYLSVSLEHIIEGEPLAALFTFKGPDVGMFQLVVLPQSNVLGEQLPALAALELLYVRRMPSLVLLVVELVHESLATNLTHEPVLAVLQMRPSVRVQAALLGELLATRLAGHWREATGMRAPRLGGQEL